jgi:hypothetical protein
MGQAEGTSRAPIGAILAIVGGALLAVGSFLSWAQVSGGGTSVSAKGVDGSDGYITLVAGLVALVAGALMMKQAKRLFAVLALLAGLVGGGIGVYDALTAKDSVLDAAAEEIAPQFDASVDEVRTLLDQAIDSGDLSISISLGLYIVIGGGVLALVGGALSMRGSSTVEPAASGSASGFATPMAASPGPSSMPATQPAGPPMPATPPAEPPMPATPPAEPPAAPGGSEGSG